MESEISLPSSQKLAVNSGWSQLNLARILTPYCSEIRVNFILPSIRRSSRCSFSYGILEVNLHLCLFRQLFAQ